MGQKSHIWLDFYLKSFIMLSMIIQITKNWNGENEENDELEKEEMEVKRWKKRKDKFLTNSIKNTI
jgi:hypothetical protein